MRLHRLLATLVVSLAAVPAAAGDLADLFPGLVQAAVQSDLRPQIRIEGGPNPGVFSAATPGDVMFGSFDAAGPVNSLTDQIGSQFQRFPVGSTVAAFTFEFDPELNVFTRSTEGLGPLISERAQTTGKGKINFALSYARIEFDVFEGDDIDDVTVDLGAGAPITILGDTFGDQIADFTTPNGTSTVGFTDDVPIAGGSFRFTDAGGGTISAPGITGSHTDPFDSGGIFFPEVRTTLDAQLEVDAIAFFLNYGITDTIDVGVVVPLLNIEAEGRITTSGLLDVDGGAPVSTPKVRDDTFGFGDVIARAKWHFLETEYGGLAARGDLVIPTGDEDQLRGFGDPAFGGTLIYSKPFEYVSPHANVGMQFRTDDPDQHVVRWAAGVDVQPWEFLTLVVDALGEHRIRSRGDGVGNDVLAVAPGLKVNPWSRLVLAGNAVVRLNDDGLRADVIPSVTVEYTFR